ncbi:MAG: hypothetical protein AAF532_03670 [Planctomycetota bacterium]
MADGTLSAGTAVEMLADVEVLGGVLRAGERFVVLGGGHSTPTHVSLWCPFRSRPVVSHLEVGRVRFVSDVPADAAGGRRPDLPRGRDTPPTDPVNGDPVASRIDEVLGGPAKPSAEKAPPRSAVVPHGHLFAFDEHGS